jgi:hypothetical protein
LTPNKKLKILNNHLKKHSLNKHPTTLDNQRREQSSKLLETRNQWANKHTDQIKTLKAMKVTEEIKQIFWMPLYMTSTPF